MSSFYFQIPFWILMMAVLVFSYCGNPEELHWSEKIHWCNPHAHFRTPLFASQEQRKKIKKLNERWENMKFCYNVAYYCAIISMFMNCAVLISDTKSNTKIQNWLSQPLMGGKR